MCNFCNRNFCYLDKVFINDPLMIDGKKIDRIIGERVDSIEITHNYCPICGNAISKETIERQRQQQIERLSTKAREFKYRAQARRLYANFMHGTRTPEKEEQNLAESKRCLKISEAYEKRAEKLMGEL